MNYIYSRIAIKWNDGKRPLRILHVVGSLLMRISRYTQIEIPII